MKRAGKEFEREIRQSLKDTPNIFYDRFVDYNLINATIQSLRGLSKKMGKHEQLKNYFLITPPKVPADFWAVHEGSIYFFECKKTLNPVFFPLKNIKEHQFESALSMWKTKGNYVFLINKRDVPKNFKCYAVNGIQLLVLREEKNKISWDELDRLVKEDRGVIELERLPKGRWSIEKIFDKW